MQTFTGFLSSAQSPIESDPVFKELLKASVRTIIDCYNQDDEAWVVIDKTYPNVFIQTPAGNKADAITISLAPRCSAWIDFTEEAITMQSRPFGIDQVLSIPYGSIMLIHAKTNPARQTTLRAHIADNTPKLKPTVKAQPETVVKKKPSLTVVK